MTTTLAGCILLVSSALPAQVDPPGVGSRAAPGAAYLAPDRFAFDSSELSVDGEAASRNFDARRQAVPLRRSPFGSRWDDLRDRRRLSGPFAPPPPWAYPPWYGRYGYGYGYALPPSPFGVPPDGPFGPSPRGWSPYVPSDPGYGRRPRLPVRPPDLGNGGWLRWPFR